MAHFVYILASKPNGTLYVGLTKDLARRIGAHRQGLAPGFTGKYGVKRLVYFETHEDPLAAAQRERAVKRWRRNWKIALIERDNPDWTDLFPGITP